MKVGTSDFSLWAGDGVNIWQYANAKNLNAIINDELEFFNVNVNQFFTNWEKDVFNLITANTFGLNVWGKILGVPRPSVPAVNGGIDASGVFRFANVDTHRWHSIWISGSVVPTLNIEYEPSEDAIPIPNQLGDNAYRTILLAKIRLLYSNGSVHDINDFVQRLLGYYSPANGWIKNENVYVQDNYNMTMTVMFNSLPSSAALSVLTTDGLSPRPAGVFLNYAVISNEGAFGFSEAEMNTWVKPENSGIGVEDGYGYLSPM